MYMLQITSNLLILYIDLDILGGGSVNTKDVRTNTAGIRKLVASKFDMSKPADAKTAALIRNLPP